MQILLKIASRLTSCAQCVPKNIENYRKTMNLVYLVSRLGTRCARLRGRGFQSDLSHKLMSHFVDGAEKTGQDFFLTFQKFDGGA
jgi:hypothetical protein